MESLTRYRDLSGRRGQRVPYTPTQAKAIEALIGESADAGIQLHRVSDSQVDCEILSSASDFAAHDAYVLFGRDLLQGLVGPEIELK